MVDPKHNVEEGDGLNIQKAPQPTLMLNRIGVIETYEVMQNELEQLDGFVAEENQALGFATTCIGVLLSALLNIFVSGEMTQNAKIIYTVVIVLSVLGSAWFTATYLRVKKGRPALLSRIKNRSRRVIEPMPPG